MELANGRSVFVKSAEAPLLAGWLRREHEVYEALEGSFIARLEGWDPTPRRRARRIPTWPFLSLGLRDEQWLERSLPELLAAIERAPLDGDDLLHFDVRSDNLCFRDGKALLVATLIAGVWVSVAGLPPPETAPNVRAVQRKQLG